MFKNLLERKMSRKKFVTMVGVGLLLAPLLSKAVFADYVFRDEQNSYKLSQLVAMEERSVTVGDGTSNIVVNTNGYFWTASFNGRFILWNIQTSDNSAKTIQVDVKKDGVSIGENIDLTAQSSNSGSCVIPFVVGNKFSFNIDANTDARKIIFALLAERT